MNIYMDKEAVLAAAKQNDANTAEALSAAQAAVKSLVALKGTGIFGVSPAGKTTDAVFGQASSVIDDLITQVNQAITVLNENLHASVDAVVKGQEVARVDYAKLTQDNATRLEKLGTTGIKPGDENYVPPTPGSAGDGNGAAGGDGSGDGSTSTGSAGSGSAGGGSGSSASGSGDGATSTVGSGGAS